jgi:hypothetical protein
MRLVANQAIRSAVRLSFKIVKVLQQHHSCSKKLATFTPKYTGNPAVTVRDVERGSKDDNCVS